MKSKSVFLVAMVLFVSLACQIFAQPSDNDNLPPTQLQEAISTAVQAPTETPQSSAETPDVEMILIPAGEFLMGNEIDEGIYTVYLDAYYIDKYEVTNSLYKACVNSGVCKQPVPIADGQPPSNYGDPNFDDHPVVYVTWSMAKSFCEWRGARLPTEAEWEKAARGTEGLKYPWGYEFDGSRVNFCDKNCLNNWANQDFDDGYLSTAPVGSYEGGKSPYGVYDMAGNVWEWVSSLYRPYPYNADDGRENLETVEDRVVRGGGYDSAWTDFDDFLRVAFRNRGGANSAFPMYGFRCAADATQ